MNCEQKPTMWQQNPGMNAWAATAQPMVGAQGPPVVGQEAPVSMEGKLRMLQDSARFLDKEMELLSNEINSLCYQMQELQKRNAQGMQMQNDAQLLQEAQMELARQRSKLNEGAIEIKRNIDELQQIERDLFEQHFRDWRRLQRLSKNGFDFRGGLDVIQRVAEMMADVVWHSFNIARTMNATATGLLGKNQVDPFSSNANSLRDLLYRLISNSLVIEQQPPQVMKTNTRFSATIRLLIGARLNVYANPPSVKVSIISEGQAQALATGATSTAQVEAAGEILNNVGAMEYEATSKVLSLSLRNMSLKKIKRSEKKGSESVMDEKFCLLFDTCVQVGNMRFPVATRSLPVVVIVHGNQEPYAWATVTWDNAFAREGRQPFFVPEAVPWSEMAPVLSMKFRAATGRELSLNHLHLLACKAFRVPNLPDDYGDLMISWPQFSRDGLPDRVFSFWEWFYAVMKTTREHLRGLWVDGAVIGFISRRETEDRLLTRPSGTFLLRFADSEPGGVSIAYVSESDGQKRVLMVQPFTARDFQVRSLADRLSDIQTLTHLYPDIPKEPVLSKYITPKVFSSDPAKGYIKPKLVVAITAEQQDSPPLSEPTTPQSIYGHSENAFFPAGNDQNFIGPGFDEASWYQDLESTKRHKS